MTVGLLNRNQGIQRIVENTTFFRETEERKESSVIESHR
jgi:hypothetical protein